MIPASTERVPQHTCEDVNQWIREQTEQRVARYRYASVEAINQRLAELDHEWDIERTLEANAATLACTGCVLTAFVHRRWVLLPMAVTGFLLQHAIQGWCPPLPILRRLGFRTQHEIDEERFALKVLRGDFATEALTGPEPANTGAIMRSVRS